MVTPFLSRAFSWPRCSPPMITPEMSQMNRRRRTTATSWICVRHQEVWERVGGLFRGKGVVGVGELGWSGDGGESEMDRGPISGEALLITLFA
jgi:hypothetical protein